ncbi:SRPBCC family protein [Pseudovibrio ascidiaceicola]|uniref:SRPBCC family protein n=1 Tax=Pseudovibrio ascidiaceicola TaxID=285279 RepID=UPI001AD8F69B|nr:SRPBCC domain-containing protein [Pseudovibrio ascidiaceicola]
MTVADSMTQEETTLRITRDFKASPEKVFDAWTNPEMLVQWWGPEGMSTPECEMYVRTGGKWKTTMTSSKEGGAYTVSGIYKVLDRPSRLCFTWGWTNDGVRGHETDVEVTFEAIENGTRMTMVQRVFADPEQTKNHDQGWSSSFNDLQRFVEA